MKTLTMIRVFQLTRISLATLLALSFGGAFAQVAPDAGELIRELSRQVPQPTPDSVDLAFPVPAGSARVAPGGPKVKVSTLKFEGNTALDAQQLAACLGLEVLERNYDLSGLQDLAERVTYCYRGQGYPFAHAFVPGQDMRDGQLRLQILEGRYGEVRLEGDERAEQARPFLGLLKPGELISGDVLERTMLLLSDQPGWKLEPVMQPGQAVGTGDLSLKLVPTTPISAKLGVDNHGNRYSGAQRVRADVQINSPFRLGDRITLNAMASNSDLFFGNATYSTPVSGNGLRANMSVSHTQYQLGKEFASLGAHGTADVVGAGLTYPLLRTRTANVSLAGQLLNKRTQDVQDSAATKSIKHSIVLPISLSFDRQDMSLGGGLTYGHVTLTVGRLSLGERDAQTDAGTARTNGSFGKWNVDVVQLQGLEPLVGRPNGAQIEAYVRLSGQFTNGNLDSSEKFGLGGAGAVRAYPAGEGTGDLGLLSQLELRARWKEWAPYLFADFGSVRVNSRPWGSNTNNTRHLGGAGVGVRTTLGPWVGDMSVAWRYAGGASKSNPAHRQPSLWLSLDYLFK